jgi:hypothetical protein
MLQSQSIGKTDSKIPDAVKRRVSIGPEPPMLGLMVNILCPSVAQNTSHLKPLVMHLGNHACILSA